MAFLPRPREAADCLTRRAKHDRLARPIRKPLRRHIRELNAYTRDPEYRKLVTYDDRAAFSEKQVSRK